LTDYIIKYLFILDHTFWSRNARKSIKNSRLEPSFQ